MPVYHCTDVKVVKMLKLDLAVLFGNTRVCSVFKN